MDGRGTADQEPPGSYWTLSSLVTLPSYCLVPVTIATGTCLDVARQNRCLLSIARVCGFVIGVGVGGVGGWGKSSID